MPSNDTNNIQEHLDIIRTLQAPSGLFTASHSSVSTGYDKAWLRDNFYTALAFEAAGDWTTVTRVWRAILDIFLKHEEKLNWAATQKPNESWQYIHARYNPETFDEYWEEWGNKQNDAIGAVLFKLGELEERGHGVLVSEGDKRIVQRLVDYLASVEYWHDPDNGVWEEYEEVHASSVGASVAGLKMVAKLPYITMPEGLIERGEQALEALFPRESTSKFCDLAQLSLLYPFEVVSKPIADEILKNLEYHLSRLHGVIRYKNDKYYNANTDGHSEEAEWTMGFPWLAIIHFRRGNRLLAEQYLDKARAVLTPGGLMPELYYSNSDRPNENTPLGWAQSLLVVALLEAAK